MIGRSVFLMVVGLLAMASGQVREGWFETRVDHFNPRSTEMFSFRYYANDEHSYARGPIFVIVGSDETINTRFLTEGLFYDIAYLEGAYMFANEHRYFGQSNPVSDATTANMDFLTIDQALADLAAWVTYLKNDVVQNPEAKVIVMGWGHGGSLATYFRTQFPHLADGVWASSGNNHADIDITGYLESVGETIGEIGGRDCYSTIFSGFLVAQNMITLGRAELLTELFHLCDELDTANRWDSTAFLLGLQRDIETEMMHLRNTASTTEMCQVVNDPEFENSLHSLNNWFAREHQFEECVNLGMEHYMAPLLETNFASDALQAGHRQRLYLQCTATGFFPTTGSLYQPFGNQIDRDFYVEVCQQAFGGEWITEESITWAVFRTNARFGGRQPAIINAHFTHGTLDPMMVTGITENVSDGATATVIPMTFRAPDLESIDPENDSEELIASKEETRNLIDSWIYVGFEPIEV